MTSAEQSEKILTKRTQAEEIQRQYDPRHLIQSRHSPLQSCRNLLKRDEASMSTKNF